MPDEAKGPSGKQYALDGYEVLPADNGGFIVLYGTHDYRDNSPGIGRAFVAFSSHKDLIAFLTSAHIEAAAKWPETLGEHPYKGYRFQP